MAETAQAGPVRVADANGAERGGQRVAVVLGIAARARDGADVGDVGYAVVPQQAEELLERSRAVPDREHHGPLRLHHAWPSSAPDR